MNTQIRQWQLSDAPALAKAISNLNVQNNLRDGLPYPYTEKDAEDYINAMLSSDKNNTFAFTIVCDGVAVGSIGAFRGVNVHRLTAELGYYISEEYWNKGVATQAVNLLCEYVFNNSDIVRIFAEPFADNAASCRVLEKAGFRFEGTLRRNAIKCGEIRDMKMYSILKKNTDSNQQ